MPAESLTAIDLSDELAEHRLLTEVDHLLQHRRADGTYDGMVLYDIHTNFAAASQEMAMPFAVTNTFQPVAETVDELGQQRRMFMWLGKCAVEVAESGREYHFSEPALARVKVEVAEAHHSQDNLRAGFAQVFISPKMSPHDAPETVAKQEHLAADDSLRVATLVTHLDGEVMGRRLQSLLVRDIPLSAWIDMLKDPKNIFGRAFVLKNEQSALSVMELFEQLELPTDKIPEGPVTLVAAVLPYISDQSARGSVERQLERFRHDQELYEIKAYETAQRWLEFDMSLADSLATGVATLPLESFIASLQHQWGEKQLAIITNHQLPEGGYRMTRQLAALLEKANQYILNSAAAIATHNDRILKQLSPQAAQDIQDSMAHVAYLQLNGASPAAIATGVAQLNRQIAQQNIVVGGGCPGEVESSFGGSKQTEATYLGGREGKNAWQWKTGVCRVRHCQSPKPTEVGPCQVCRACQHLFDSGRDPAKVYTVQARQTPHPITRKPLTLLRIGSLPERQRPARATAQAVGSVALAA